LGKFELRTVAAHFNHQLRGSESDADEEFVRELCTERNIELSVGRSTSKYLSNIEQNARVERYEFLQKTASNVDALAVLTAHTVNDQAETFLLNLIRGSGINGLSGRHRSAISMMTRNWSGRFWVGPGAQIRRPTARI